MTDQTIPAEKVRELIEKFKEDTKHDCIVADLRALLPAQQPTTGLLGRWAKHPEHGDVLVVSDRTFDDGEEGGLVGVAVLPKHPSDYEQMFPVSLSNLTFPEQATKPEDVPASEPWLVSVEVKDENREAYAFKETNGWIIFNGGAPLYRTNGEITLISPLTPERPGKDDLQARYDAMEGKSWEAVGKITELKHIPPAWRIEALSQDTTPHTVTTEAEYAALPVGSKVSMGSEFRIWEKTSGNGWKSDEQVGNLRSNAFLSGTTRTVLRYGWGDAQSEESAPAWRIEHDHTNLRVGEYIIDKNNHTGTIRAPELSVKTLWQDTATGAEECAPFIVFPSKGAATQEAILEAKRARDKEMEK